MNSQPLVSAPPTLIRQRGRFIDGLKRGIVIKTAAGWRMTHLYLDAVLPLEPLSDYLAQVIDQVIRLETTSPTPNGKSQQSGNYLLSKWLNTQTLERNEGILCVEGQHLPFIRLEVTGEYVVQIFDDHVTKHELPQALKALIHTAFSRTPNQYKGASVCHELATGQAEKEAYANGYILVAGVDESGRGALAGSMVAAAVLLDANAPCEEISSLAQDSKGLDYHIIAARAQRIKELVPYGIGVVSPTEIDELGLDIANNLAFIRALENLPKKPDFVLIDGGSRASLTLNNTAPYKCIPKGERYSLSIAAASILAKDACDRLVLEEGAQYPLWRFDIHRGYTSPLHIERLQRYGASPLHRKSFKPVKAVANLLTAV